MLERVLLGSSSGIGAPYWLGAAPNPIFFSIALDASANVFTFGEQNVQGAGASDFELFKLDNTGALLWQNAFGNNQNQSHDSNRARWIGADASGNSYLLSTGSNSSVVAKYDASGTLQWQKNISIASNLLPQACAVDNSGNVYFAATYYSFPILRGVLTKLDASGNFQWSTQFYDSSNSINIWTMAINKSGSEIIVAGRLDTGGAGLPVIVKFNSSGTLTWFYAFGIDGTSFQIWDCCFDASNNFYVTGPSGSGYTASTVKFYSFNFPQWVVTHSPPSGFLNSYSIAADPTGNVYIGGQGTPGYIWKYNSSGTIQWQRQLTYSGSVVYPRSLTCDTSGNLYFTGWASGSPNLGVAGKLPADGSLTGTYGNWSYSSSSGSSSTGSLTSFDRTYTSSSFSPTVANASMTSTATTFTWTRNTL